MTNISLSGANDIAAGAFSKAQELNLKPLAVVVLDAGGHMIACQRQDGASIGRVQIAVGKAAGALFLGLSSCKVAEMAAERPAFIAALGPISPNGIVPAPGGIVVVDETAA